MKISAFLLLSLCAHAAEPQILFDGKTLDQWQGTPGIWSIEDGAITASIEEGENLSKNEFLYWKDEVADFDLKLEYRISGPTSNSGIQIRSKKNPDNHAAGYQADLDAGSVWLGRIYDEHGRGLIGERGTLTKISPAGERHSIPFSSPESLSRFAKTEDWNEYFIRCRGNRIEIHINGIHFTTLEDNQRNQADLAGRLAVQIHSGAGPAKIQFRNIRLTQFEPNPKSPTPAPRPGVVPKDAPNIGFENGNYEGWESTGTVWGKSPVKGDTIAVRERGNTHHQGSFWIGGYEEWESDEKQGTLTSKPFKVTHPWASYLIGAGPGPETRVEIIDASTGDLIHKASGRGEVEEMARLHVDLQQHLGKTIRIRVVDEHSGPWGHLNYDDFRFHKNPSIAPAGRLSSSPLLWDLKKNPAAQPGQPTDRMWVPEGFQVETIAHEPQLRQPIAFTFDSRGRIWIAEAFAYPLRRSDEEANDRIIILEDKDGNGSFESHKVFADKLNLISGFEIGYGGVFAACSPEFIFIPDANGDDIPDGPPQVLLDGFDLRDTHETPNSFLWGHDGWLYGCHGVFNNSFVGKPGTPKEKRTLLQAGIWRFHPVTHDFEIYARGGSNQWGLDYSADGSLFMTHCRSSWGLGPVSQVIRDGHYWTQNNSNHREFIASDQIGWNRTQTPLFNLSTSIAAYGHGEGGAGKAGSRTIFGGHSHVGAMIYLGDNWPEEYRGNLFTHNLHGHQLNRELLMPRDSAYLSSSHGQDLLYTDDKEYLAIDLKYGPDGAVYSIDWRDTQQCHVNDTASWNRSNGSLYRMSWKETFEPLQFEDLATLSEGTLLSYLKHDNEWFGRMAQHQIRQRAAKKSLSSTLASSLRTILSKQTGPHRFRHLVALHGTGKLNDKDFEKLLSDPDETVRTHALHLLTNHANAESIPHAQALLDLAKSDPSPRVRLALAGALQHRIPEKLRLPIIEALAMRKEDRHDRFIPKFLWYAYSPYATKNPSAASKLALKTPLPLLRDSIIWELARKNIDQALATANQLSDPSDISQATAVIHQVLAKKKLPAPTAWAEFSAKAGATGSPETIAHIAKLNSIFGIGEMQVTSTAEQAKQASAAFAICAACHQPGLNQLGPSLEEIAKIYDNKEELVSWIKKPVKKRENYPQMPPFDKLDSRTLELAAEHLLRIRNRAKTDSKKMLFLAGRDSHGWGSHQHFGGTSILARGIRESALPVEVSVIREWPSEADLLANDALVIYADGWGSHPANGHLDSLKKFMDQGGGLTVIHWATGLGSPDAGDKNKDHSTDPIRRQWRNLVGADFEPWHSVSRFWDASFEKLPNHPVTRGVPPFVIHDECYFHLRCTDPEHTHVTPLHGALPPADIINPGRSMDSGSASAVEAVKKGEDQYCAWGFDRPGGGRTFGFTGGHTHWNWGRDELRKLILNGIYWTTGADVPQKGISSTRPTSPEMLANLQGNPGWTEKALQIGLDRAGKGELIKWGHHSGAPLPFGPQPIKKDLGPGTIIEGESLRVIKSDGPAQPQVMTSFATGLWSGNSQLWWIAGKKGATLTAEFIVPTAGDFDIHFAGTKAIDYGIHSFTINGTSLGAAHDFYQSKAKGVSHTGQVSLGKAKLKAGKNILTITAAGTNPQAVKNYMFGLDFIRLAPAK